MMNRAKLLQLIVISVGIPVGMLLSNRSIKMHEAVEHPMAIQHSNMDHGLIDVSDDPITPSITSLTVQKDKMSGWNISINTENFKFTPAQVNTAHIPGQGHAHIYVNGEKFARLYAPDFHMPVLGAPIETIRITLNANGHETMAIGEEVIEKIWRN